MDWQSQLVSIYLTVCNQWREGLFCYVFRKSNNANNFISDEEILTIFFFCIMKGCGDVKSIYRYTSDHLREWFPSLKDYEAFNYRLNKLAEVLPLLVEGLQKEIELKNKFEPSSLSRIVDSLPVILAKQKRSEWAKVAPGLAAKGYCASKEEYYYGVKIHVIGVSRNATIPFPEVIQVTPANVHDIVPLKDMAKCYYNLSIYGDKAYGCEEFQKEILASNGVKIIVPVKKKKDVTLNLFEQAESASVSKIRQPIESLFNWLNQKTKIQIASKVRSTNGLLVHIFGRIATALLLIKIGEFNF
jgi:hypothetical protein